jgi:uncharacterized membrane-anchored protein YitT (DUF2179 family)
MHIVSCQKIVAEWFLLNVPAMVLGWFFAGGAIALRPLWGLCLLC